MIKILIAGDLYGGGRVSEKIKKKDFSGIVNDIYPYFEKSNFNIVNLECPLTDSVDKLDKTGPNLKCSKDLVEFLSYIHVDLVTLANNHIMDFGVEGLKDTIELLESVDIDYTGAGLTEEMAEEPCIKELEGRKIAFVNVAENEFIRDKNGAGANKLDIVFNYYQIREAKERADKVIFIIHGGNELHTLPAPAFKKQLRFFADAGADAVIAHHTHYFNGYEIYKGTPIFYGLGNFLFDAEEQEEEWHTGVAVQLKITDANPVDFEIIPFYQNYRRKTGIELLRGKEKERFLERSDKLTAIIKDDERLMEEYRKHLMQGKESYFHYLQPYTNRYLHKLFSLGIIPSILNSKRKRLLLLNLIRCESHRNALIELLDNEDRYS